MREESRWGNKYVDALRADLRKELPDAKGFSDTNIFYMTKFYRLYTNEAIHQVEGQFEEDGSKKLHDKDIVCLPRHYFY